MGDHTVRTGDAFSPTKRNKGTVPAKQQDAEQKATLPPILRKLGNNKSGSKADEFLLQIERINVPPGSEPAEHDSTRSRAEPHPEPGSEKSSQNSSPGAGKVGSLNSGVVGSRLPRLARQGGTVSMPQLGRPPRLLMQYVGGV